MNNESERRGRGLILGTFPAFSWRYWGKPRKSLRIVCLRADIWTRDLRNAKQECSPLDRLLSMTRAKRVACSTVRQVQKFDSLLIHGKIELFNDLCIKEATPFCFESLAGVAQTASKAKDRLKLCSMCKFTYLGPAICLPSSTASQATDRNSLYRPIPQIIHEKVAWFLCIICMMYVNKLVMDQPCVHIFHCWTYLKVFD
jgi:hypothetical protein